MRLVTRKQALEIDRVSQKKFGRRGEDLMEEAGQKMVRRLAKSSFFRKDKNILVVCGKGNNGGDALVMARELKKMGCQHLQIFSEALEAGSLSHLQAKRVEKLGLKVEPLSELFLGKQKSPPGILIDGIFGVGLNRPIESLHKRTIEWINSYKGYVVSIDVPSGLDIDSGRPLPVAVKADQTLTIGISKLGFYLREGPALCGKVDVIPIGFPKEAIRSIANRCYLMDRACAQKWWVPRMEFFNKSKFGRSIIVAGSKGKEGAAILSCRAAFRIGSGYVIHSSLDGTQILDEVPEVMTSPYSEIPAMIRQQKVAVAIGPGSGAHSDLGDLLTKLRGAGCPVVLDADALSWLAESRNTKLPKDWILTPHSGELARLLNTSVDQVESDPLQAALTARKIYGCTIVLKGLYTLVVSGRSGRCVVVPRGNVALAKAGTGDVLTGMIVGLLAQGLYPLKAALLGIYLHGAAADIWTEQNSKASMIATDVIEILPRAIKELEDV